ncbi:MAG: hypothetical protein AAF497_26075, partial [Planctomycetota bacterium]
MPIRETCVDPDGTSDLHVDAFGILWSAGACSRFRIPLYSAGSLPSGISLSSAYFSAGTMRRTSHQKYQSG